MANICQQIEKRLKEGLLPLWLDVINESHQHRVAPGSETHFKIVVVSEQFGDKKLVARHRMVYQILQDELRNGVHALAIHTYTPQEWEQLQQGQSHNSVPDSPPCASKNKK